jgi:hypothetical protein
MSPVISTNPDTVFVTNEAGYESFEVLNEGMLDMYWTATTEDAWITFSSDPFGLNNGYVDFDYTENTEPLRFAHISVSAPFSQNDSDTLLVFQSDEVKIENLSQDNHLFEIFPNPADDELFIRSKTSEIKRIQIMDVHGRSLYDQKSSGNRSIINISDFEKGLYIIRLTDSKGTTENITFIKL